MQAARCQRWRKGTQEAASGTREEVQRPTAAAGEGDASARHEERLEAAPTAAPSGPT